MQESEKQSVWGEPDVLQDHCEATYVLCSGDPHQVWRGIERMTGTENSLLSPFFPLPVLLTCNYCLAQGGLPSAGIIGLFIYV